MASLRVLSVVAVVLLFALADTSVATKAPDYIVQGRVYCDTCRAGFEMNVTEYIKGTQCISGLKLKLHICRSLNMQTAQTRHGFGHTMSLLTSMKTIIQKSIITSVRFLIDLQGPTSDWSAGTLALMLLSARSTV
jgi:hypothetical protein